MIFKWMMSTGTTLRGKKKGVSLKKNDVEEEKKEEVEKEKEKKVLDQEERWKEIQERRAYERLHAPQLPFPYKAMEKQLQAKFLKFFEHMRELEMKIPFLEAVEQMPQYAKYLKTHLRKQKEALEQSCQFTRANKCHHPRHVVQEEKARGPFVLSVTLGKLNSKAALADLGVTFYLFFVVEVQNKSKKRKTKSRKS